MAAIRMLNPYVYQQHPGQPQGTSYLLPPNPSPMWDGLNTAQSITRSGIYSIPPQPQHSSSVTAVVQVPQHVPQISVTPSVNRAPLDIVLPPALSSRSHSHSTTLSYYEPPTVYPPPKPRLVKHTITTSSADPPDVISTYSLARMAFDRVEHGHWAPDPSDTPSEEAESVEFMEVPPDYQGSHAEGSYTPQLSHPYLNAEHTVPGNHSSPRQFPHFENDTWLTPRLANQLLPPNASPYTRYVAGVRTLFLHDVQQTSMPQVHMDPEPSVNDHHHYHEHEYESHVHTSNSHTFTNSPAQHTLQSAPVRADYMTNHRPSVVSSNGHAAPDSRRNSTANTGGPRRPNADGARQHVPIPLNSARSQTQAAPPPRLPGSHAPSIPPAHVASPPLSRQTSAQHRPHSITSPMHRPPSFANQPDFGAREPSRASSFFQSSPQPEPPRMASRGPSFTHGPTPAVNRPPSFASIPRVASFAASEARSIKSPLRSPLRPAFSRPQSFGMAADPREPSFTFAPPQPMAAAPPPRQQPPTLAAAPPVGPNGQPVSPTTHLAIMAFEQFDTDHSGNLDVAEFHKAMQSMGMGYSFEDAENLFMMMDDDGNGEMSMEEFLTHCREYILNKAQGNQGEDGGGNHEDMVRQVFQRYDNYGGGYLEAADFYSAVQDLGLGMSQEEAEHAVSMLDADGSGAVSEGEFMRYCLDALQGGSANFGAGVVYHEPMDPVISAQGPLVLTGNPMADAAMLFRRFDADGNGFLDIYEFMRAMKEMGFNLSFQEARDMFSQIDVDGSGTMEEEEFTTHYINHVVKMRQ